MIEQIAFKYSKLPHQNNKIDEPDTLFFPVEPAQSQSKSLTSKVQPAEGNNKSPREVLSLTMYIFFFSLLSCFLWKTSCGSRPALHICITDLNQLLVSFASLICALSAIDCRSSASFPDQMSVFLCLQLFIMQEGTESIAAAHEFPESVGKGQNVQANLTQRSVILEV